MTKITVSFVAALMAASQAVGQSADDPGYQMLDGIGACLLGGGDVEATTKAFADIGWSAEVDAEMGLVNFLPTKEGQTFGYMPETGAFCQAESLAIGTEDAQTMFNLFLMGGNTGIEVTQSGSDAQGCTTHTLSTGAVATLMSGGNDPVCAAETNSAVRFAFPGGN